MKTAELIRSKQKCNLKKSGKYISSSFCHLDKNGCLDKAQ